MDLDHYVCRPCAITVQGTDSNYSEHFRVFLIPIISFRMIHNFDGRFCEIYPPTYQFENIDISISVLYVSDMLRSCYVGSLLIGNLRQEERVKEFCLNRRLLHYSY